MMASIGGCPRGQTLQLRISAAQLPASGPEAARFPCGKGGLSTSDGPATIITSMQKGKLRSFYSRGGGRPLERRFSRLASVSCPIAGQGQAPLQRPLPKPAGTCAPSWKETAAEQGSAEQGQGRKCDARLRETSLCGGAGGRDRARLEPPGRVLSGELGLLQPSTKTPLSAPSIHRSWPASLGRLSLEHGSSFLTRHCEPNPWR
jgi:hypothetical protein